jgi:Tol biopolymer transport system component
MEDQTSPPRGGGPTEPVLAEGARLGPYVVERRLGAGGMGEVDRARDPRLDRSVAIKVLRAAGGDAADARARFQREARVVAQLQHPNICALHDVGETDGRDYLVMEMLAGETLADRLARGPLPVAEVLEVGAAVAAALAAAHRRGVLHRDLKPGNVMLTKSGPKLLDFGLAKLAAGLDPATPFEATRAQTQALTAEGTLLGTLAYMAPEQLQGRAVDARADLWALGCVLYEMATGLRAFAADTPASTIVAILEHEPPALATLQAVTPPGFDRLVRACLAKDPDERWDSAATLERELRWLMAGREEGPSVAGSSTRPRRGVRKAAMGLGGVVLAVAGALAGVEWARRDAPARRPVQAELPFAGEVLDSMSMVPQISPDGTKVVVGSTGGVWGDSLWLLSLDSAAPQVLSGTAGGYLPFWSSDGRSIGFFAEGQLKRLDLGGASPVTLCAISDQGRGGAWSSDGTILFSPGRTGGLLRIAATGGTPEPATTLDPTRHEVAHRWPQFLGDGERFLYWATANSQQRYELDSVRLGAIGSVEAGNVVLENTTNAVASKGHLLFRSRSSASWAGISAQRFDAESGAVHGAMRPLVDANLSGAGVSMLRISANERGDLVYLGVPAGWATSFNWYDMAGNRLGSLVDGEPWGSVALSRDGRRAAIARTDLAARQNELWVIDLVGGARRRVTLEPGDSFSPAWSPDGSRLAYVAWREGSGGVYVRAVDGGGEERVLEDPDADDDVHWSPDGRSLLYRRWNAPSGSFDVHVIDMETREGRPYLAGKGDESSARWSPDGHFVAYASNESGQHEIYLRNVAGDAKWQLSQGGGLMPRWMPRGREVLYVRLDGKLMAVPLAVEPRVEPGTPRVVFDRRLPVTPYFTYDVHPDGDRIIVDDPPAEALDTKVRLLLDWPALLER